MNGFDDLIKAMEIFKTYDNPYSPFHCKHDTLCVMVSPDKVSEEDKKRLSELGFEVDKGNDTFYSFRFGSA